jgi:hypothetical protein
MPVSGAGQGPKDRRRVSPVLPQKRKAHEQPSQRGWREPPREHERQHHQRSPWQKQGKRQELCSEPRGSRHFLDHWEKPPDRSGPYNSSNDIHEEHYSCHGPGLRKAAELRQGTTEEDQIDARGVYLDAKKMRILTHPVSE